MKRTLMILAALVLTTAFVIIHRFDSVDEAPEVRDDRTSRAATAGGSQDSPRSPRLPRAPTLSRPASNPEPTAPAAPGSARAESLSAIDTEVAMVRGQLHDAPDETERAKLKAFSEALTRMRQEIE